MALDPLYIVGAGRVGCALGLALKEAGAPVVGIWSRSAATAERTTALLGIPCSWGAFPDRIARARTVIIAVADPAVNETAGAMLDGGLLRSAHQIFHCGGGCAASVALSSLRVGASGAARHLGTLHPLWSFADPVSSSAALAGAFFGIEGSPAAKATARELLNSIGATPLELTSEQMALYHCAAVMASNQAIGIWSAARDVLAVAGIPADLATSALLPLIRSTVDNLALAGLPEALTGPVRRGDLAVIRTHLDALAERCPEQLDTYRAGTRSTVTVARQLGSAPEEAVLERILAATDPASSE